MFEPVNLFYANVSLVYPLKYSENYSFSDVSRGYRKEMAWVETSGLN